MRRRPLILTAIGLASLVIAYAIYWFMVARIVAQDRPETLRQSCATDPS